MGLSTGDLDSARASLNTLMPDQVQLQQDAAGQDDTGAPTHGYSTVQTVNGRLTQAEDTEVAGDGTTRVVSRPMVVLPHNVQVRQTDRIVIGSRVFEVVSSDKGGAYDLELHVMLEERGEGQP